MGDLEHEDEAMSKKQQMRLARREFVRTFGVAAVAIASAGLLAEQAAADTENNDEKRKPRYRESDHVKAFYRVNRYPR
jgi:hypothetical protein